MTHSEFDTSKKLLRSARNLRSKYISGNINGKIIDSQEFINDLTELNGIIRTGAVITFAHQRIRILRNQFRLHISINSHEEHKELQQHHVDVYNIPKVDNHIHLAAAFPPKMIIEYFKEKLLTNGNDEIADGIKLKDVMNSDNITSEKLGIHANQETFLRFDRFNYKYNLYNKELVRKVFLKTDNHLEGKYFGS